MRHSRTVFNERILADTLWIHQPRDSATTARGIPILAIIDSTTKLMAARVIPMEKSEDFLKALERGWIRHFGTPGAVSSSEAGALITVSTLRSLQAKHTPDLASWKDVTKFYDEPSSSSWHKATSLSPQTTSSRR